MPTFGPTAVLGWTAGLPSSRVEHGQLESEHLPRAVIPACMLTRAVAESHIRQFWDQSVRIQFDGSSRRHVALPWWIASSTPSSSKQHSVTKPLATLDSREQKGQP